MHKRLCALLVGSLLLNGCASISKLFGGDDTGKSTSSDHSVNTKSRGKKKDDVLDVSQADLYKQAKAALQQGYLDEAIKKYERLEALYPFGREAAQGQLDLIYAYFKFDEPDQALAAAARFQQLYPNSPFIDYVYFMKGLVNYTRDIGFLDRYLPTDLTQRDPGAAREALKDFDELLRKFPNSKYAKDARQRVAYLRNRIALNEMQVAEFYMRRKAYAAAAERANLVIRDYQRTVAVPMALEMLQQAYQKMGLPKLAADTKQIYAYNYRSGTKYSEQFNTRPRTFLEKFWNFIGLDRN